MREQQARELGNEAAAQLATFVRESIAGDYSSRWNPSGKAVEALNDYIDARVRIVLTELLGNIVAD
jgi:hypothetical protein